MALNSVVMEVPTKEKAAIAATAISASCVRPELAISLSPLLLSDPVTKVG
jgi:hypothetical protein